MHLRALSMLPLLAVPAAAYDLPTVEYRGSMAVLGNWHDPSPMPKPKSFYWGTYLFQANAPLEVPYTQRTTSIIGAGSKRSGLGVIRDLDCSDMAGPIQINGPDPHRLDADNDGVGCED